MRKGILIACCVVSGVLSVAKTQAQIKGDPIFNAKPQPLLFRKSSSSVSPALQKLYEKTSGRIAGGAEKAARPDDGLSKYMQVAGDKIVVDITVKGDMSATKTILQQLGLQLTGQYGRMLSGYLPIASVPQLANIKAIQFARPAYKPMRRSATVGLSTITDQLKRPEGGTTLPVPVISQGDTAQRSYLARKKYNVSGKGVKVGILSDSYNYLGTANAGILQGELPGPGNPFNYKKPVDILEDYSGTDATDEGRGMAEIVHDVAPGAELAFHTAFAGEADFAQGIQDLANKGCKVIVDDVGYFDEPFFQDGIIAQSVDAAKKKGVAYFSAAGNNGNTSYESDYHASTDEVLGAGIGTAHNFSAADASPRYYQPIYIPSGGSFAASFQWDQPSFSAGGTGCESDLDIYLFDIYGNLVAAGGNDNIVTGDPIEFFGFDNNTPNYTFFLVIIKAQGPDPTHIKYNMYADAQFFTPDNPAIPGLFAPTLVGHPNAAGAIATGAAFYLTTPAYGVDTAQVEFFSSLGGVANYFDASGNRVTPVVRRKPDITAPDGGNTSFFNPFGNGDISQDTDTFPNFFGTSAAAPHAAGVAALMIEAERLNNLTPDQIKGVLSANASDMDNIYTPGFDKGFDLNTGYGLIKADKAVDAVKFPNLYIRDLDLKAVCSVNPSSTRSWKITNPNPFEVDACWLLLGTNQKGTLTLPPGESIFSTNALYFGNYPVPNIAIIDWEDNFGFTRLDIANSSTAACGSSSARTLTGADADAAIIKPMIAEVYPNPATNTFRVYLALADGQPVDLQLFSIDGKKLMDKRVGQAKGIVPIDAAAYRPGVYLLQVKQGAFNKTIKLIKQ